MGYKPLEDTQSHRLSEAYLSCCDENIKSQIRDSLSVSSLDCLFCVPVSPEFRPFSSKTIDVPASPVRADTSHPAARADECVARATQSASSLASPNSLPRHARARAAANARARSTIAPAQVPNESFYVLKTKKKYKPVDKKVHAIIAELPSEYRIVRHRIGDPLENMPLLSPTPSPDATAGRYNAERREKMRKDHADWLLPAELDLLDDLMCKQNQGFAWDDSERGTFRRDAFPPVRMPVVAHTPYVERNFPIPPGIRKEACELIERKIAAGVYEPSNASYRSRWFCVLKKDGKVRIVHSLEPLNRITIQHSGVPPIPDDLAEQFAGRACGTTLDLYVGYDERELDEGSRDLTTFQTPFGAMRLTTLPMGWSNSVPIFHDDVTFILQPEIPHVTIPYIDDVTIKGPASTYQDEDGTYETIPENPGIRRYVWEHLQDVNRIVQRVRHFGGTFSGKKTCIARGPCSQFVVSYSKPAR